MVMFIVDKRNDLRYNDDASPRVGFLTSAGLFVNRSTNNEA